MRKDRRIKKLLEFLSSNSKFLNFLVSLLFLCVYFFITYFGSVPNVSNSFNVYSSYKKEIQGNLDEYLLKIEELIKNKSQSEEFTKTISEMLNSKDRILKDSKFIETPIKYIYFKRSSLKEKYNKVFLDKDNNLRVSVRYNNSYFSVDAVDFILDFKSIVEEVTKKYSNRFDVFLGENGNIFLSSKSINFDEENLKEVDSFFSKNYTKDKIFYLEKYKLTLYEGSLPSIKNNIYFIYKDGVFSLPKISLIILFYLFVQTSFFLALVFKEQIQKMYNKKNNSIVLKHNKIDKEIIGLLEEIEVKRGKEEKSLTKEEKFKVIKNNLKNNWDKPSDFLDFLEKELKQPINSFTFKRDIDEKQFIYDSKIGFLSNNITSFTLPEDTEVVGLMRKNNILSVSIPEIEKTFLNDYLDSYDKKRCEVIYFVPFFYKKEFRNVLLLGI